MNNAKLEFVISDYLGVFQRAALEQEAVIQKELETLF
jgi:hypothetical protein